LVPFIAKHYRNLHAKAQKGPETDVSGPFGVHIHTMLVKLCA
jgi:hypothetical protein